MNLFITSNANCSPSNVLKNKLNKAFICLCQEEQITNCSINLKINATIALDVSENELITRLLDRGKTNNRSDDQDIEKIKNRFNEYNTKTSILINFYNKQGKFYSVDGKGTVNDITLRLFGLVDSLI